MGTVFQDGRLNNGNNKNVVRLALKKHDIDRSEKVTYQEFIKSEAWEVIKKAWYKKYIKNCKKCNSYKNIQLHHICYPNRDKYGLGQYRKVQDKHFISLCRSCHQKYHDEYGTFQDMITTSIDYIGKPKHNKIFVNRVKEVRKKRRKEKKLKINKKRKPKKRTSMSASQLLSF